METRKILVADDDHIEKESLATILQREGYETITAGDGKEALEKIESTLPDLVLTDLKMPYLNGLELLTEIKSKYPDIEVIIITGYATVESAINAMKVGAIDYISKPFNVEEVKIIIRKTLEQKGLREENAQLKKQLKEHYEFRNIIGSSHEIQEIIRVLKKVVGGMSSVMITGEEGTGKELLAKTLHFNSPRKDRRFVTLNCGAFEAEQLDEQIFGSPRVKGAMEQANRGTLFMDEIENLPLSIQVKLLKCIKDKELRIPWKNKVVPLDIRFVTATTEDLGRETETGRFREDLYYRLTVIPIHIPPLRERLEDIPLLVNHFIHTLNEEHGKNIHSFSSEALDFLMKYNWQGNITELHNVMERAVILTEGDEITIDVFPVRLNEVREEEILAIPKIPNAGIHLKEEVEKFETKLINHALKRTNGVITLAAEMLKLKRTTLVEKTKRLKDVIRV
ncbi:MAG: sigma-54-dependent Fis family transcriptional regulator [Deltaproteobacteria bacterium]|nr:sigma-54-dependent Fis family transcriptional regulator [Deltaproteobacteria bacterium]